MNLATLAALMAEHWASLPFMLLALLGMAAAARSKNDIDVAEMGATSVNANGTPLIQSQAPTDEAPEPTDLFQGLGISAAPWLADENGVAEGVRVRAGGRSRILIGGRDTRTSKIIGALGPGDTVVHTTGPNMSAQLQLKETKRQAALLTKMPNGKTLAIMVDGVSGKIQIGGLNCAIDISESGLAIGAQGAGLLFQGGKVFVLGELSIPGMRQGTALMSGPPTGTGNTNTLPIALFPVQGVSK